MLEAGARLLTDDRRWLNDRYVELSAGFPELEALVRDVYRDGGGALVYCDEFLYAPRPTTTRHVNFTHYHSARYTADSVALARGEHIVWAFGGSTMENTETTDSLTIANTWARYC